MADINKLLDYLAQWGGEIVSTAKLTPNWIEQARASGRLYVREDSLGFVWEPPINRIPETDEEIEFFERWFPIPVKLPKELEDPSAFFELMKKRQLEDKQKKEN